jgi:hypothetical protein
MTHMTTVEVFFCCGLYLCMVYLST